MLPLRPKPSAGKTSRCPYFAKYHNTPKPAAYLTAHAFKAKLSRCRTILIVLSVLAAASIYADKISFKAEQSYFGDPVVYQSHSPYRRLVVTR